MLKNPIQLKKILFVFLILISTAKCASGLKLEAKSENCEGTHLVFITENRKDKEFMVSNNRIACEECKESLSNEERKICEEVE